MRLKYLLILALFAFSCQDSPTKKPAKKVNKTNKIKENSNIGESKALFEKDVESYKDLPKKEIRKHRDELNAMLKNPPNNKINRQKIISRRNAMNAFLKRKN